MVLAIIGLAVGLFVVNIDNAIEGVRRQSASEVLLQSFRKARLMAVTRKQTIYLNYNPEIDQFELKTDRQPFAETILTFPLDESDKASIEEFRFWPIEPWPEGQARRSYEVFQHQEPAFAFLEFDSTGISNFVAVEIVYDPQIADSVWMLMDPFSSAVLEGEVR